MTIQKNGKQKTKEKGAANEKACENPEVAQGNEEARVAEEAQVVSGARKSVIGNKPIPVGERYINSEPDKSINKNKDR